MKVLTLKLGDVTYTTERITTGLSREALRVQEEAFAFVEKAEALRSNPESISVSAASETISAQIALSDRKLNLIVRTFGNKFTIADLEDNLTNQEVDVVVAAIVRGVTGIVSKN